MAGAMTVGMVRMSAARARSAGGKARKSIGRANGGHHAAADPLQDAEGDELADALREAAQRRAGGKHRQGEEEDLLGAEAVAEPAGSRDPDREAERVAGNHPFERGVAADVELLSER